jgi:hypothetical protein
MGMGLLAGTAIGMVGVPHRKTNVKRTVGKAIKTVGEIVENASDAMGL